MSLIVRGVDSSGYASVRLDIEGVTVEADHTAIAVKAPPLAVELASAAGSAVASFSMPAAVSRVDIAIALAPTGAWRTTSAAGQIDARGLPLSFEVAAADLLRHGIVEVRFDVTTSLQPTSNGGIALLPQVTILF